MADTNSSPGGEPDYSPILSAQIKQNLTPENYQKLTDTLLEIKQIKYEEYLVKKQLSQIECDTKHLQDLLNVLKQIDSEEQIRSSKQRKKRLRKPHSKCLSN